MSLLHFYRIPALSESKKNELLSTIRQKVSSEIKDIQTEYCFNIETTQSLTSEELKVLRWLLSETFEPENFSDKSFLTHCASLVFKSPHPPFDKGGQGGILFEVGPRMNFTTAWSTNAVSVCHACGLNKIMRIERSRRYKLVFEKRVPGFEDSGVQAKKSPSLESLTTRPLEPFVNKI